MSLHDFIEFTQVDYDIIDFWVLVWFYMLNTN